MCAIGPSRNQTPQSGRAAGVYEKWVKVFRRREQAESKADFAAMPGAVHTRTRAARRKIQRGYRRVQQAKNGGYALI